MPLVKDISGQKFGRLTALSLLPDRGADGSALWECACDCGKMFIANGSLLRCNKLLSCGCYKRERSFIQQTQKLVGKQIGHFTLLKISDQQPKSKHRYWDCQCICGTVKSHAITTLIHGGVDSCGCRTRVKFTQKRRIDLTGRVFHRWTVIERNETKTGSGTYWWCVCDCGTRKSVYAGSLLAGTSVSCGCYMIETHSGPNAWNWDPNKTTAEREETRDFPEYNIWRKRVLKRDKQNCQKCGHHSRFNHAHHIESYAKAKTLRTELSNGITLCYSCHRLLHSKFGQITCKADLDLFLSTSDPVKATNGIV